MCENLDAQERQSINYYYYYMNVLLQKKNKGDIQITVEQLFDTSFAT